MDIYNALNSAIDLMNKYNKIIIFLTKEDNYPRKIIKEASRFCKENNKTLKVLSNAEVIILKKGQCII